MKLIEQLLAPTGFCFLLLLIGTIFHKHTRLSKTCLGSAMAILLLAGNGWFVRWMSIPLERRIQAPEPIPQADAIMILGGAIYPKEWPRRTVEVSEAGDRVLYAFELYRQKKAPLILCAGGLAEPGIRDFSEAEDMRTLLQSFGMPAEAILVETNSLNTVQNARYSQPLIRTHKIRRILLVTTALHMPRAVSVVRNQLPDVEIIPAPTDYLVTDHKPEPFQLSTFSFQLLCNLIPSGENLMQMETTLHEYIGLLYYRLRGWI